MTKADKLYCSFCGKSQHEVRKLIAGPTVFICDECALLCVDIIIREADRHDARLPNQIASWVERLIADDATVSTAIALS